MRIKTSSSNFVTGTAIFDISAVRFGALAVILLMLFAMTGCGIVGRGGRSSSELARASEAPLSGASRAPRQIALKSTKVLPKPDFGVTPEVQEELNRFLTKERATVQRVLVQNAHQYEATKRVFEGHGVPPELLSVAAVESGFNARAASPAGARGMWQFMKSTARLYGLKVERRRDERLDPQLSTVAAAQLLRDLFVSFQDWHLALAAYNAGSGAVNRVVSREGESDFWELARNGNLPSETRRFVPRVIALSLIFSDPNRYGFAGDTAIG